MALNATTGANASTQAVNDQNQRVVDQDPLLSISQMAALLADAYHQYAKGGTLPGADLTPGGTVSILEAGYTTDNTDAGIIRLAQSICDYWATNNATGAPAHGGNSVQSVTIDGAAKYAQMESAIRSIITDQATADGWLNFYNATQTIVQSISCTVVELMPPDNTPQAFPETIT